MVDAIKGIITKKSKKKKPVRVQKKRTTRQNPDMPSFGEEKILKAQGYRYIAGVDEAGRGALAGPVVAAAVILPMNKDLPFISQVRDSKKLTPLKREYLFHHVHESAVALGIGMSGLETIDTLGIVTATRLAMKSAIEQLSPPADYMLVDYMRLPEVDLPQKGITHGDDLSYSIACASIIAKVSRDRLMMKLNQEYSGYGLANHKGYGTREHVECLRRLGPCPIHRKTFSPVREMI
ncbi:MAG: ribonuclease HII [Dehalococcoidales bacterium]|nr:ribonuclease HII [Dehalococcoidales bacterium]